LGGGSGKNDPKTVEFMTWVRDTLESTTAETYGTTKVKFTNVERESPYFAYAHPRPEHFTPLFVAIGAMKPTEGTSGDECSAMSVRSIFKEVHLGSMGVEHFIFN
jgi:aromatic ring-opening dioxygenase catalytic subunit (LigB family)